MSVQTRQEILYDLQELRKLQQSLRQGHPQGAVSFGPPLVSSQFVPTHQQSPNYLYPQAQPLQQTMAYSQVIPRAAPLQSVALHGSHVVMNASVHAPNVIVSSPTPVQQVSGLKESIKGESFYEYVPFEKVFYEQQEVKKKEVVNVQKKKTDYYAIEKQVEYVPYTKYDTIEEVVPQQKTEYIAEEYVEYVPEVVTEMVPVERVQEKVEYQQVNKKVVHHPQFDRQFAMEAETSGRIIQNPGLELGNSLQVNRSAVPLQSAVSFQPQPVYQPQPVLNYQPQPVANYQSQPVVRHHPQPVLNYQPQPVVNYQPQLASSQFVSRQPVAYNPQGSVLLSGHPHLSSSQVLPRSGLVHSQASPLRTFGSGPYHLSDADRNSINLTKKSLRHLKYRD